jgi:hypothetical protein
MTLEQRLKALSVKVEQLINMSWSYNSDYLYDLISYMGDRLPEIVGLDAESASIWHKELDEDSNLMEFLRDRGYSGWYFSLAAETRRYIADTPIQRFTGDRIFEYGYAESYDKLEAAINETLDRIEPRLVEKK